MANDSGDGISTYVLIGAGVFVVVLLFFVFVIASSSLQVLSPNVSINNNVSDVINVSYGNIFNYGFVSSPSVSVSNNTWLVFDGVTDSVNMSNYAVYDVFQGPFSISFWVNVSSYNNNVLPRILEKRTSFISIMGNSSNSRYGEMALEMQNLTGSSTIEIWSRDQNVTLGSWEHWVVVWNGTNGTWFKNGVMNTNMLQLNIGGNFVQSVNTSTKELYIGKRSSDDLRNFNGSIDEIRFYNTNLSNGDVGLLFNNSRVLKYNVLNNSRDNNMTVYIPFSEGGVL